MITRHHILMIFGLIVIILFSGAGKESLASDKPNLLLISSYHPAFPTFFQQIAGIQSELPADKYNLDVEFMDSKRFHDEENFNLFLQHLTLKLSKLEPYAIVFAADDNALNFVLSYQDSLFSDIPIIFLGVNNIKKAAAQNKNKFVTGVLETTSIKETIDLARSLIPRLNNVTAISDGTTSGQADLDSFLCLQKEYSNIELTNLSLAELTWSELANKISSLPSRSCILLLSAYIDKNNKPKLFDESLKEIISSSSVPVFHLWEHGINEGIIGGKIIRHFMQGREAGLIAKRILSGEDIGSMIISNSSPNQIMLDYNILKKFGINYSNIPDDAVIINNPVMISDELENVILILIFSLALTLLFILVLIRSIRKMKRIEKKLRMSEETFKTLFNQSTQFSGLLSTNGEIIRLNSAHLNISGLNQDEIRGKIYWENAWLNDNNANDKLIAGIQDAAAGRHSRFISQNTTCNNESITVDFSVKPVFDIDNNVSEILIEGRDITQIRNYENRLNHIERMESLGILAGGIAHDFNNLLGGIIGCSELIQSYLTGNKKALELNNMILKSSVNATNMIQKMLIFARKSPPAMKAVDMHAVIEDSLTILSHSIDKLIEMNTCLTASSSMVIGDQTQLESVFINLGINAYHAMPEGGVIEISTRCVKASETSALSALSGTNNPEYIMIIFRDNGKGIEETNLSKIFTPFFTTKEQGKGTGLGLSAVYGIIQQHNGVIAVSSILNEGTTFEMYLPVTSDTSEERL